MGAIAVIDHQELGSGGAAYWEKTSIPVDGTYDHLLLKASIRGEKTSVYYDSMSMTVNSVTSAVYCNTAYFANSTTITGTQETSRSNIVNGFWPGNSVLADTFGCLTVWIPHYANTANYKAMVMESVSPNNSTTNSEWIVGVAAVLYEQTTAISSIKIASGHGTDLEQYSTFTLYGITGV